MEKWATLEPVRLYKSSTSTTSPTSFLSRNSRASVQLQIPYIGPLPVPIHIRILRHLPITSIPNYAIASKALSNLARSESIWEDKCKLLGLIAPNGTPLDAVVDVLEQHKQTTAAGKLEKSPPVMTVIEEDEFGDFASASFTTSAGIQPASPPLPNSRFEMGDFIGASATPPQSVFQVLTPVHSTIPPPSNFRNQYIRAHKLLKPLLPALLSPAHLILNALFPSDSSSSLRYQSQLLHLLALFLSPYLHAVSNHANLLLALRSAIDRFDSALLTAFDAADTIDYNSPDVLASVIASKEQAMRDAAWASWEVYKGNTESRQRPSITFGPQKSFSADWELGKVWAEKKEIFYETGNWDPLKNFTSNQTLDFRPMDEFMSYILNALKVHGAAAVRIFPPPSRVLLAFADRVAVEVVGEYIIPLLTEARSISNEIFLKAAAASFVQAWKIVDVLMAISSKKEGTVSSVDETPPTKEKGKSRDDNEYLTRNQAEDVVYQMFEPNMDEYLDEEVESLKQAFEIISRNWDRQLNQASVNPLDLPTSPTSTAQTRFLSSHNPAQVKRTVLASFTDVLLLPVTIVPRAVGAIGSGVGVIAGGARDGVVSGISMLNPQRWGGQSGIGSGGRAGSYGIMGEKGDGMDATLFEVGEDEDEEEDSWGRRKSLKSVTNRDSLAPSLASTTASSSAVSQSGSSTSTATTITTASKPVTTENFSRLQLYLSLDIALEIIHASRESLKRTETFQNYPGTYGHKVRETVEELFILMLQTMSERHIGPGFSKATEQMRTYKPAEHEETASVAPLMQFFELVHIGDTIQSMVQVYFDKELAPHIDRTDFLNGVVREKKRFENTLDDSVAAGLNTGTEVLMNQVEHIILLRTAPREYYPMEGVMMELGPTRGCTEAITCLETHCKLLKGSTSKEVLEVFYQEVGIRLNAIIQKHIKRQIISLEGGFQVIADLNAYHTFISSLKVPQITEDFANLKMIGHVFIVSDAKDLAQIVRDVTRYGGSFRPEDVYEFIQRRSDWKKIEKTVDKTMYNLSFKEDCLIC